MLPRLIIKTGLKISREAYWVELTLEAPDEVDENGRLKIEFDPPPPNLYILKDLEAGKQFANDLLEAIRTLESS